MTEDVRAAGSSLIQNNSTGLCIATGKSVTEVAAGDYLVMRTAAQTNAQAWVFATNPGPIAWGGDTNLQIGWDAFGKVLLVSAPNGLIFTYNPSPGTFTNDDNGTTEYLSWNGVPADPGHTPLRATPSYLSFTCDWTIVPFA